MASKRAAPTIQCFTYRSLLAILITFLVCGCRPDSPQTDTALAELTGNIPQFEAEPAWEGTLRVPGWTELHITLTHEGTPWAGALELEDTYQQAVYRIPLELEGRAQRELRIPLYVTQLGLYNLTLKSEDGAEIRRRIPLHPISNNARTCIAVTPLGSFVPGPELACDETVALTDASDVPGSPLAWDAIDVLILDGADTTQLSSDQRDALLAWVGWGGRLVVGGGPGLGQALAGLPARLRIATPAPGGSLRPAQDIQIARSDNELITAVSDQIGAGSIDVVGQALDADLGLWLAERWANDSIPATSLISSGQLLSTATPAPEALLAISNTQLPDAWGWIILLAGYVLVLGPGTWIITKRLRRPMLSWVLLPAWTLAGLVVAGLWLNGTFASKLPVANTLALVVAPAPDVPARAVQGTAIFAPRTRSLRWTTAGTPRPLWGAYTMNTNEFGGGAPFPMTVTYQAHTRAMQTERPLGPVTWAAEGLVTPPDISAHLTLIEENGKPKLTGVITSALELTQVIFLFDGESRRWPLADTIAPHTPHTIQAPWTQSESLSPYMTPLCPGFDDFVWRYGLSSVMPMHLPATETRHAGQECHLAALTQGVPFPTDEVIASQSGRSCLKVAIPCPEVLTEAIPLLPRPTDEDQENTGWIDERGTMLVFQPYATFQYRLPAFIQQETIAGVRLEVQDSNTVQAITTNRIQLALWDWQAKTWRSLAGFAGTDTLSWTDPESSRYFAAGEGIRIRLTPASGVDALEVDLALTAILPKP